MLGLVAGNAFFVIGEYAVVTARRGALSRRRGSAAALRLMDDPVRVISTVQVGITAIGILAGALAEPLVRGLIGDALPGWATYVIAFGIVTYLSVVFGELVPKALTLDRAETLAVMIARPIELISIVLRPVVWVLQGSAAFVLRPFGIREVVAGESIRNAAELRALVDEAEQSGIIPRAQEELLHNVFDFPEREARDIMVPALDVCWLDADLTPDAALDRHVEHPHARYPVGRGSLDRLEGVVHVHDIIAAARSGQAGTIAVLARPALIVPETKDVGALLREQRAQKAQLALVVDEYGAVAGIVTLEDVLEELVGEIQDEFDLPDGRIERLDDGRVRVAGSITIDDFNEAVGTELPQTGPRTLAGLVFDALGRRPVPGDAVESAGATLAVEQVDDLRITGLLVTLPRAHAAADGRCCDTRERIVNPFRVVSATVFSPRGGSAYVARALARCLQAEGIDITLVAGSRSDADGIGDARRFYAGVDVRPVDFSPALDSPDPLAYAGGPGEAPLHPSFEDRPAPRTACSRSSTMRPTRCRSTPGPARSTPPAPPTPTCSTCTT